ncbi:hypothetical protein NDU88_005410 [Pleurodeles waltl]|uniref:Uncharacterized protein n=1 Tax=Pleurodeles waltl TaxID=8319 RepID=A0AAV7L4H9_PLEWA|nr:hypothetical protein NDU88_005410 [Pleurodeles waltl]
MVNIGGPGVASGSYCTADQAWAQILSPDATDTNEESTDLPPDIKTEECLDKDAEVEQDANRRTGVSGDARNKGRRT